MSPVRRKAGMGSPFHALTFKQLFWALPVTSASGQCPGNAEGFHSPEALPVCAWKVSQHRTRGKSGAGMSSGAAEGNVAWDSEKDAGVQVRELG